MAKTRSGLGRGLGSLLGDAPDELVSKKPEVAPPPEEEPRPEPAQTVEQEEIYANNEDHVVIKGVRERVVIPQVPEVFPHAVESAPAARQGGLEEKIGDFEIDIDLIEPNPDQPRIKFKEEDLRDLADSIKKNGLLQPILVRKVGEKYQIIAGERRYQACKSVNLATVPVHVKEADDDEAILLALIENIQRSDLNPIEEAYGYKRMMERGHMTQNELSQAISKSQPTISNALRLLKLPELAQELLFNEKITAGHARVILTVPTDEGRIKMTERLMEGNMTVRQAEAYARLLSVDGSAADKSQEKPKPKSYQKAAKALKEKLDAPVRVRSSKGKNKIEIEFKDEDDLKRLLELIAGE